MAILRPIRSYVFDGNAVDITLLQSAIDTITSMVNTAIDQDFVGNNVEVKNVVLGTTNTEVTHKLGRLPTKITATLLNAGVIIYCDTVHPDPNNKSYVKATAPCIANLLIA